jgi:peptidylprolyl isomerase/peptidyl-prolyl cis-trans isomerase D
MGTMNKMRENTGVVLWILVFAFGVIWVLQDSGGLDVVGTTSGTNIIVVDGDAIPYEEYSRAVDAQVQQYQQQTGETMPPQMLDQQREFVYTQLVENKLREHEMDRLGINVTNEEVYEMVMGPDPHPIIQTYFGDEQGNVNRALLQNFIDNPEARQDWIQIENYLRAERRREKMDNLIAATVRVSEQDVLEEYRRRNLSVDAEWVGLRYSDLPNDSVMVTDADLERYYDENREDYERPRTYTLNYVTLSKQPTAEDSTAILAELERLEQRFVEAEDDSLFVARNASESPFSDEWHSPNELDEAVAEAIFPDPESGSIVGPFVAGNQAHLVKIRDVRPAEAEVVRARHILIRSESDNAEIETELNEIKNQIAAGNLTFAEAARAHSQDGSASQGGDLGWFGRGQMVDVFDDAAFEAPLNEVVGPIKSRFGYHLIEVQDRASSEVKISDLALQIRTDIATLNNIQEQLEDLRYFSDETGDFEEEAERLGLNVQTVQITPDQQMIPGLGSSRTILNFLESAAEGELSPVIELDDVFVVGEVEEIIPEGYRPFDDVRSEVQPRVYIEKKKELLSERIDTALENNDFDALPQVLGTQKQTAENVTFSMNVVPGLGREPRFTGTALGIDEGETSGVVAGENAVFVVKAISVDEPAPITEAQRAQLRNQMLQQRRTEVRSQWLAQLRERAAIEDHRSRFLQQ